MCQFLGPETDIIGERYYIVNGGNQPDTLKGLLVSLAQLWGNNNFKFKTEVAVMGPRAVLAAMPLNIKGEETDYKFKSSWPLPVLRDNICRIELEFFSEYFLPLAAKGLTRSQMIWQKTFEVIAYQIWSLLPEFCNCPTDIATSFKSVAMILGEQLGSRKEIKLDILTSLRHLVALNLENEENKVELARYSKNFLPILFNLYTRIQLELRSRAKAGKLGNQKAVL